MQELGADSTTIAQHTAHLDPDDTFEVWPPLWEVIQWFVATDDLYRWHNGFCLGLDLVQLQAEAALTGRQFTPEQFEDLRFISHIFADELTKKANSSCPTSLRV